MIKNSRNNYSFAQYYNIKPNTSKSGKFKPTTSKQYKGFRSTKDHMKKKNHATKGIRVQVNLLKKVTNKIPLIGTKVKKQF